MVEAKRGDGVGPTTLHVRALNIVPISRYVLKIIAIRLYGTTLKKKTSQVRRSTFTLISLHTGGLSPGPSTITDALR